MTEETTSATTAPGPASEASSAPTSATTETSGASETSAFDFESIFGDFGASGPETEGGGDQPPSAPAEPAVEVTPQPLPGAEPGGEAKPPPPPAQPSVPPAPESSGAKAPTAGAQAPASPSLDFSDPGALATALLQNRAEVEAHVAKQLFALTPEEIEALETDVVGTVPKLLAKTYVAAQTAVMQQLQRIVPAMMQRQMSQNKIYEENSSKFFKRWNQLDPQKHGDLVYRSGVVWRQMNPQATLEQMIESLGPLVLHAAGLPLTPAPPAPQSRPASPFAPAQPGAVGIPQPATANEFAYMQETGD